MRRTGFITKAAVIAGIYIALTLLFASISYKGPRLSEVLTILPYFTPAAIPGLFIGCLIANLFSPNGIVDIIAGSLATLIAALLSYVMPRKWLVPLPPVVVNALVIGPMLSMLYNYPFWITVAYVAAEQAVVCYAIGYPLLLILEKYKDKIFL